MPTASHTLKLTWRMGSGRRRSAWRTTACQRRSPYARVEIQRESSCAMTSILTVTIAPAALARTARATAVPRASLDTRPAWTISVIQTRATATPTAAMGPRIQTRAHAALGTLGLRATAVTRASLDTRTARTIRAIQTRATAHAVYCGKPSSSSRGAWAARQARLRRGAVPVSRTLCSLLCRFPIGQTHRSLF